MSRVHSVTITCNRCGESAEAIKALDVAGPVPMPEKWGTLEARDVPPRGEYRGSDWKENEPRVIGERRPSHGEYVAGVDLCPACFDSLWQWWQGVLTSDERG